MYTEAETAEALALLARAEENLKTWPAGPTRERAERGCRSIRRGLDTTRGTERSRRFDITYGYRDLVIVLG